MLGLGGINYHLLLKIATQTFSQTYHYAFHRKIKAKHRVEAGEKIMTVNYSFNLTNRYTLIWIHTSVICSICIFAHSEGPKKNPFLSPFQTDMARAHNQTQLNFAPGFDSAWQGQHWCLQVGMQIWSMLKYETLHHSYWGWWRSEGLSLFEDTEVIVECWRIIKLWTHKPTH